MVLHNQWESATVRKTIFSREQEILLWRLQRARRDAGLTQRQLAERLQRAQAWVSECETGERRVDALELRAICAAIGVPFPQFIAQLEDDLLREGL